MAGITLDTLSGDEQVIWMKAWDKAPSGEQEKAAIAAVQAYRKKQIKPSGGEKKEEKNIYKDRQEQVDKYF